MGVLKEKFIQCIMAAAAATGCKVDSIRLCPGELAEYISYIHYPNRELLGCMHMYFSSRLCHFVSHLGVTLSVLQLHHGSYAYCR